MPAEAKVRSRQIVLKNSRVALLMAGLAGGRRSGRPRALVDGLLVGRRGNQLGEHPEVLGGGGEQELGSGASRPAQPEAA